MLSFCFQSAGQDLSFFVSGGYALQRTGGEFLSKRLLFLKVYQFFFLLFFFLSLCLCCGRSGALGFCCCSLGFLFLEMAHMTICGFFSSRAGWREICL